MYGKILSGITLSASVLAMSWLCMLTTAQAQEEQQLGPETRKAIGTIIDGMAESANDADGTFTTLKRIKFAGRVRRSGIFETVNAPEESLLLIARSELGVLVGPVLGRRFSSVSFDEPVVGVQPVYQYAPKRAMIVLEESGRVSLSELDGTLMDAAEVEMEYDFDSLCSYGDLSVVTAFPSKTGAGRGPGDVAFLRARPDGTLQVLGRKRFDARTYCQTYSDGIYLYTGTDNPPDWSEDWGIRRVRSDLSLDYIDQPEDYRSSLFAGTPKSGVPFQTKLFVSQVSGKKVVARGPMGEDRLTITHIVGGNFGPRLEGGAVLLTEWGGGFHIASWRDFAEAADLPEEARSLGSFRADK